MTTAPVENINIFQVCCACHTPLADEGIRFPRSQELRRKWVNVIMSNTPNYNGKRQLLERNGVQLCVEHFEPQILIPKQEGALHTFALRKGGCPSIFKTPYSRNGLPPTSNGHPVDSTTHSEDEEISICYEMIPTPEVTTKSGDSNNEMDISNCSSNQEVFPEGNVLANDVPIPADENGELVPVSAETGEIANSTLPCQNDLIPSLKEFIELLQQKNDSYYEPWRILYNESSVVFLLFDTDCKYLVQSFTVGENLNASVYFHGQLFTDDGLIEVLGQDLKLDSWTKFKKLILFLHTITKGKLHHTMKLRHACKLIQDCIDGGDMVGVSEKEIKKWKFSLNQIEISDGQNKSYTPENLKWAMSTYMVNRVGYAKIYESEFLTLPHPASLELYKKQLHMEQMRKQQIVRSKFTGVNPVKPSLDNGVQSTSLQQSVLSIGRNKFHVKPTLLKSSTSANHITSNVIPRPATSSIKLATSSLMPPTPSSIDVTIDDDDCEIQEI